MEQVESVLRWLGVAPGMVMDVLLAGVQVLLLVVAGWVVYVVARRWVAGLVARVARRTSTTWDDLMFDDRFFGRAGLVAVPLVMKFAVFTDPEAVYAGWVDKVLTVWLTVAGLLLVSAVLDGVNRIYENYPVSRHRPLKVFIQIIKVCLYCAGAVVVVSVLMGKSPEALLVGMGAFAAVLMLVFKDTILGFVAGVQLMANNMIRLGDWIVMPTAGADGTVLEINLTTVKVQNWDKTISTIPTYKLVSESFTNWRGMWEAGGRRVKRSVNIDVHSIHYLSGEEIEGLKRSELLRDYIEGKERELAEYNARRTMPLDERRMTNIGVFREYLEAWLAANPNVNLDMVHVVRQLQPGPTGLPLEIYCFSARQQWVDYERVQADIFDHVLAVLPLFGLRAYEYAGREMG